MRSLTGKFLVVALSMVLVAGLAGCRPKAPSAEAIYIGMVNPMSGDNAWVGETKVRAVRLAVNLANEAGGIDGREIRLLIEDDAGDAAQGVNMAEKVAADVRVVGVIGHWYSTVALAALPTYTRAGIPLITDAASEQLSNSSRYMFRICLTDNQMGRQVARYMYEMMGHRTVATMYPMVDFGVGVNRAFTTEFRALGGTIVAEEGYMEGTRDYSPQLTRLNRLAPDAVFLGGYYTEGALILQQAEREGLNVPFYGTDGLNAEDIVSLGGRSVEGVKFVGFFHPDLRYAGTQAFVDAFRKEYGMEPDSWAALAFDSANLILEGIRQRGATREGVRAFLAEVEDFPGVAGPISFMDSGDSNRLATVMTIKNGKIVPADVQW